MAKPVFSHIADKSRYLLDDSDPSNYETSNDALYSFIDDEYQIVLTELRLGKKENYMDTVDAESTTNKFYELPYNFISLDTLQYENSKGEISVIHRRAPDVLDDYETQEIDPPEGRIWCFEGNYIRIYPVLATGGYLKMRHAFVPDIITVGKEDTPVDIKSNLILLISIAVAIRAKIALEDNIAELKNQWLFEIKQCKREMNRQSQKPIKFQTLQSLNPHFTSFDPKIRSR